MAKIIKEFWITNITKANVTLHDLNLTINAYSSINLLGKNCRYTEEQIQNSLTKGSLFARKNKVVVRKFAPQVTKMNVPYLSETFIPTRERSILSTKQDDYEELHISDEQFAEDNADIVVNDSIKG